MSVSPGPGTSSRDVNWFSVLLAGLAALLCVRVIALYANGTDLFFDEAQYWAWSEDPALGYFSKPPLIAWIIGAATTACGAGEACVRLPSPLLHTATALTVFWLGQRLYDARIGALSALAFATLPGVSLSAGLISTDVPLLLCWALALVGFSALLETDDVWPALLLGAAFGAGLNAKYAMAWFVLCAAVYLLLTPERRGVLRDWRLYLALAHRPLDDRAEPRLELQPQLRDPVAHGRQRQLGRLHAAPEQGARVLRRAVRRLRPDPVRRLPGHRLASGAARGRPLPDRLLLAFSVPIIAVILVQAFLSRAHANWAATAYVAASVLVIANMVRDGAWGWLKASFIVHAVMLALIVFGTATAGAGAAAAEDRSVRAHARMARSGGGDARRARQGRRRRQAICRGAVR